MRALDRFEQRVERLVNSAFARAFRSEVKPVEIVSAIRRAMDDRAAALSQTRTVVPNEFTVRLSASDLQRVTDWGAEALGQEIAAAATEYAASQDYAVLGPVTVAFTGDEELRTGRFHVQSETKRGTAAPASAGSASYPMLDIDGQRYLLSGTVTVLGRDASADIVISDTGISRRHLELRTTPHGTIATDLGSTNGTFVEGHRIEAATLVDGNTITIGRTQIMFWNAADGAES